MKNPFIGRISAAKAGWVIGLLFFGWLAFVFLPWPKSDTKEPPPPAPVDVRAPYRAKLVAVGLPDNSDLDGLPEMFAIWADKAHWKNDRTKFAYWNPGSQDYTYFFEATRENGRVRFRQIRKPWEYEEEYENGRSDSKQDPIRLIAGTEMVIETGGRSTDRQDASPGGTLEVRPKVKLDLPVAPATPAPPEVDQVVGQGKK